MRSCNAHKRKLSTKEGDYCPLRVNPLLYPIKIQSGHCTVCSGFAVSIVPACFGTPLSPRGVGKSDPPPPHTAILRERTDRVRELCHSARSLGQIGPRMQNGGNLLGS
jgi:hypothetical protein